MLRLAFLAQPLKDAVVSVYTQLVDAPAAARSMVAVISSYFCPGWHNLNDVYLIQQAVDLPEDFNDDAAAVLVRHAAVAPVMRWRGGRRGRGGGGAGAGVSRRRRRRCGAVSSAGAESARSAALVRAAGEIWRRKACALRKWRERRCFSWLTITS